MTTDEELKFYIKQLARYERKLSSLRWNFWRGIVYGLGFFIGSAILAAVLIYFLSHIKGWGGLGQYIHDIVEIIRNGS